MTYDRDFNDFLTTTVTYAAHASMSLSGAQTFSTASLVVPARIEQETKLVRDVYGKEVVSQTQVFMRPTSSTGSTYYPTIKDQITLPSGYVPATPPIINVTRQNDVASEGGGVHHWQVLL
jgi:hypothetical protein